MVIWLTMITKMLPQAKISSCEMKMMTFQIDVKVTPCKFPELSDLFYFFSLINVFHLTSLLFFAFFPNNFPLFGSMYIPWLFPDLPRLCPNTIITTRNAEQLSRVALESSLESSTREMLPISGKSRFNKSTSEWPTEIPRLRKKRKT